MKILDAEMTRALLPFDGLIDALNQGFRTGCVSPIRHHHTIDRNDEPDATLLLMPAWSHSRDDPSYLGVKIVMVVPGNTARGLPGLTSTYILYDGVSGAQLALLDGNVITARRTVATSALAARYLSREDSETLLVIGSGRVASLLPQAYRAVRPIQRVLVWDIDAAGADRFVDTLRSSGMKAEVVSDLETAVSTADIVTAATLATEPLVKGAFVRPGTHIDLIGGFTPRMREADDDAVVMSSVFVDTPEALIESGDLTQPLAAGIIGRSHVRATLADLAAGKNPGRTNREEITYFKAVGSALADIVAARMVYEAASGAGVSA